MWRSTVGTGDIRGEGANSRIYGMGHEPLCKSDTKTDQLGSAFVEIKELLAELAALKVK